MILRVLVCSGVMLSACNRGPAPSARVGSPTAGFAVSLKHAGKDTLTHLTTNDARLAVVNWDGTKVGGTYKIAARIENGGVSLTEHNGSSFSSLPENTVTEILVKESIDPSQQPYTRTRTIAIAEMPYSQTFRYGIAVTVLRSEEQEDPIPEAKR